MSLITDLKTRLSPDVREAEPMAKHTTFRIGGPAEYFFEAKTADDAARAAKVAAELGIPRFVFGGGSNMLVADTGIKGLVVKMSNRGFAIEGTRIVADAGAPTGVVSTKSVEGGLAGFEWAVGIPGTIGGAVWGNAGANGEMKDVVESVRALRNGAEVTLTNAECAFAYRDSLFKREPAIVILSATLALRQNPDVAASRAAMQKHLLDRNQKQPVDKPCAGCVFTNWRPGSPEELESLRRSLDLDKDEKIPVTAQGTVPAGWIIDRAQLKGMKLGHVMISEKHGNFIVSDGQATADDVISMTAAIKMKVRNTTHGAVQLVEEIQYVGF